MSRRAATLLIAAALALAGIVGWRQKPLLAIGVAYKAKTLCSGVFVSKRPESAVLEEVHADDLAILRLVSATVDPQRQTVTASVAGLLARTAIHRGELGCALVPPESATARPSAPPHSTPSSRQNDPPAFSVDAPSSANARLRAVVDATFDDAGFAKPRHTRAVAVLEGDRVLYERYTGDIGADTPLIGWSMTKSAMNALVGILVREGKLSIESPAPVPEWRAPGDPRAAITVDHLLRMSSGLRFDEDMLNPAGQLMQMLFAAPDTAALPLSQPLAHAPGTQWQYSSGTSNIIARVIRTVIGDDEAYHRFARAALFEPLGMRHSLIETDRAGNLVGASNMYASTHDWARLGLLYLRDGVWNGRRILPEGWVSYSASPAPADRQGRYGAHFWREVPREFCASGTPLPDDVFHAAGHEGQFVTIVPSRSLVIVRLGRTRHIGAWDQCTFVRDVLAATPPRTAEQ